LIALVESFGENGKDLEHNHHRKFIEFIAPSEPTNTSPNSSCSSGGSSPDTRFHASNVLLDLPTNPAASAASGRAKYHLVLSFDEIPSGPNGSWRFGEGSAKAGPQRGVDLLLCPPKQKFASSAVGPVFGLIYIHPESGAVMIQNVSRRPIIYLAGAGNTDIKLGRGDRSVLHLSRNHFRFSEFDYVLDFHVQDEDRFVASRNDYVSLMVAPSRTGDGPYPQLDPLPKQTHHRVRDVIFHRTISSGTYGGSGGHQDFTLQYPRGAYG
jgi:hypothetical protein